MTSTDRTLPSELQSEGWFPIGEHGLLWCHEASHQCVTVSPFTAPRALVSGVGGFMVGLDRRNAHGYPTAGASTWVKTHEEAVRLARSIRSLVAAGVVAVGPTVGPSFDDVIRQARGAS